MIGEKVRTLAALSHTDRATSAEKKVGRGMREPTSTRPKQHDRHRGAHRDDDVVVLVILHDRPARAPRQGARDGALRGRSVVQGGPMGRRRARRARGQARRHRRGHPILCVRTEEGRHGAARLGPTGRRARRVVVVIGLGSHAKRARSRCGACHLVDRYHRCDRRSWQRRQQRRSRRPRERRRSWSRCSLGGRDQPRRRRERRRIQWPLEASGAHHRHRALASARGQRRRRGGSVIVVSGAWRILGVPPARADEWRRDGRWWWQRRRRRWQHAGRGRRPRRSDRRLRAGLRRGAHLGGCAGGAPSARSCYRSSP